MGTLIVDRRGTVLSHQGGALVVTEPDSRPRSIPLALLERVVIAGAVKLDGALLTHLAEQGVTLVAMPTRGNRRNACLFANGHGDGTRRLGQYALVRDPAAALGWARRFVLMKLLGEIRLLRRMARSRPDCRLALTTGIDGLAQGLRRIRRVNSVSALRGQEGAAAAQFFAAYASAFPPALSFHKRTRRPPRDPANALLSLGYTLVHADAVRALTQSGLDPLLGFLHEPAYNRESLACDLVEVARARIERLTWRLFAEQQLRAEHFHNDGGAVRLGKAGRGVYFAEFEEHAFVHRRWFRRLSGALASVCAKAGKDPGDQRVAHG